MVNGKNYQSEDLEGEVWRPVLQMNNRYLVSNKGRVKALPNSNHKKTLMLHQCQMKSGYMIVHLRNNGKSKTWPVHRLVAYAFLPHTAEEKEVNHKDENPLNNNVENLEWCTHLYNMNYGTLLERMRKKNTNNVALSKKVGKYTLNGDLVCVYPSVRDVKRTESIKGFKTIYECCNGNIHSAHGYMWAYIDEEPLQKIMPCKRKYSTAKCEVNQYDVDGKYINTYGSITEASKAVDVASTNITACCKGKYKTSGGYIWKYKCDCPSFDATREYRDL